MTWGKTTVTGDYWVQETRDVFGKNGSPNFGPDRIFDRGLLYEDDNAKTSVNTPGFRKQKRRQLPDHPHYWQVKRWDRPIASGTKWFQFSNGVTDRNICHGPSGLFQAYANEDASLYPGDDPYNQAVSRLQNGSEGDDTHDGYSGVKLSSGSLGVGMAEAAKTAEHMAHTATRLVNAYRSLRKGHLGDFAQGLGLTVKADKVRAYRNRYFREKGYGSDMSQFAAQSWLEFTYGWKPLLSDFYAQAKNLAEIMIERQYVVRELRVTAKSRRLYEENRNIEGESWKTRKLVEVKNRVALVVRYSIHEDGHTAQNVFGLNNPALIAWEIVPFSFVADWFLPIGDWLDSLTAYDGLVFHSGTRTNVREAEIKERAWGTGAKIIGNPTTWWTGLDTTATNSCLYKSRSLLTSFPRKTLEFKDPRSFAHAASAIALIQSVFQGSRGRQATSVSHLGNKTLADFGGSTKNYRKYFPDAFAHL